MLTGDWPKVENCYTCGSERIYLKTEFLDAVPPLRVYRCLAGHENIVYMRNPRFRIGKRAEERMSHEPAGGIEGKLRHEVEL